MCPQGEAERPSMKRKAAGKARSHYSEVELYTQMSILQEVDKTKLSKSEIATKFNIPYSTLCNIITNRAQVEDKYKNQYVNMLDLAPKSGKSTTNQTSTSKLSVITSKSGNSEVPVRSSERRITRKRTASPQNDKPSDQMVVKIFRKSKEKTDENTDTNKEKLHFTRKSLNLSTKMSLIKEIDKGNLTKKELSEKYEIPFPTLSTILKHRDKIEQCFEATMPDNGGKKYVTEKCKEVVVEKDKSRKRRVESTRQAYDLKTKLKVIAEVDKGKKSKMFIANKYHMPQATLSCILKRKEKLLSNAKKLSSSCKRLRDNPKQQTIKKIIIPKVKENGTWKRATIDLFTKVEILKEIDNKELNKTAIAEKFNIATSTVTCISKNRDKIENFSKLDGISKKKYRSSAHMEIEHRLLKYLGSQPKSTLFTNTQLCLQAVSIAHELGYKDFKCHPSSAWIWRFKRRFNVASQRSSNEERTRLHDVLQQWRKVRKTGNFVCDLCSKEMKSASAMEKHLMSQHFPNSI